MKLCGIYEILNTVNGKRYIGQSADIQARWNFHTTQLRNHKHHNKHLQSAWDKYGQPAFRFDVICICSAEHLTILEQAWMDTRKPEYNLAPAAGSVLGIKRSPETRDRISKGRAGNTDWLGKTHTPETKKKMSAWQLGKPKGPRSLASRVKQSIATKGVPKTLAHREKIAASNTGKKWSDETRAKLTGRPCSPETRARISAAQIARLKLKEAP